jgi:hypothetical protein
VPKFSIDRFPAGFFDLSQDLSRGLPIDVIERWTRSDHSLESALKLLEPARIECAVVSTDSAGLTLMTERRGLIEMLALINRLRRGGGGRGRGCLGRRQHGNVLPARDGGG